MDYKPNKKNKDETKEKKLKEIITSDSQIKRENIIEAESISFNNTFKNLKYDEYGFVDKNDSKKKRIIQKKKKPHL